MMLAVHTSVFSVLGSCSGSLLVLRCRFSRFVDSPDTADRASSRTPNPEPRTPNAERRTPNAERRTPNRT
jgi:hypothetical protein